MRYLRTCLDSGISSRFTSTHTLGFQPAVDVLTSSLIKDGGVVVLKLSNMEAVGAASSIAGLVSLSGTILAKGYAFLGSVHRAPKELRELLSESAALAAVLDQIQTLAEDRQDEDAVGRALTRIAEAGALEECNVSLLFVDNSIRRCQQIDGHKFSNAGKKLLWPFQEKETKDGVARLARLTSYLSTALTTDMA